MIKDDPDSAISGEIVADRRQGVALWLGLVRPARLTGLRAKAQPRKRVRRSGGPTVCFRQQTVSTNDHIMSLAVGERLKPLRNQRFFAQ